jgi:hypothetical protein
MTELPFSPRQLEQFRAIVREEIEAYDLRAGHAERRAAVAEIMARWRRGDAIVRPTEPPPLEEGAPDV